MLRLNDLPENVNNTVHLLEVNTILYYNEQFGMKYGHLAHLKFC